MSVNIDLTTAAIFFAIGFVTGAAVALWNTVAKISTHERRYRD